jgi:hypothetical protein
MPLVEASPPRGAFVQKLKMVGSRACGGRLRAHFSSPEADGDLGRRAKRRSPLPAAKYSDA